MSPELQAAVEILEQKASRPREFSEDAIIEALLDLGATEAADVLRAMFVETVEQDDAVRKEALAEAQRLRNLRSR